MKSPLDVGESFDEAAEDLLVELLAGRHDGGPGPLDQLVERPVVDRHSHHGAGQQLALLQPVERAEGHDPREVAGDPEDDEHVGRSRRLSMAVDVMQPPCRAAEAPRLARSGWLRHRPPSAHWSTRRCSVRRRDGVQRARPRGGALADGSGRCRRAGAHDAAARGSSGCAAAGAASGGAGAARCAHSPRPGPDRPTGDLAAWGIHRRGRPAGARRRGGDRPPGHRADPRGGHAAASRSSAAHGGAVVWASNVVVFSLLYWELDGGGACSPRPPACPGLPTSRFRSSSTPRSRRRAGGRSSSTTCTSDDRLHCLQPHRRHAPHPPAKLPDGTRVTRSRRPCRGSSSRARSTSSRDDGHGAG